MCTRWVSCERYAELPTVRRSGTPPTQATSNADQRLSGQQQTRYETYRQRSSSDVTEQQHVGKGLIVVVLPVFYEIPREWRNRKNANRRMQYEAPLNRGTEAPKADRESRGNLAEKNRRNSSAMNAMKREIRIWVIQIC